MFVSVAHYVFYSVKHNANGIYNELMRVAIEGKNN